jgi:DNA-binding transcriptional ArsR family regulator
MMGTGKTKIAAAIIEELQDKTKRQIIALLPKSLEKNLCVLTQMIKLRSHCQ